MRESIQVWNSNLNLTSEAWIDEMCIQSPLGQGWCDQHVIRCRKCGSHNLSEKKPLDPVTYYLSFEWSFFTPKKTQSLKFIHGFFPQISIFLRNKVWLINNRTCFLMWFIRWLFNERPGDFILLLIFKVIVQPRLVDGLCEWGKCHSSISCLHCMFSQKTCQAPGLPDPGKWDLRSKQDSVMRLMCCS